MKKLIDYEYYRTDLGILYCGDCLEILPLIEDEISLIFTDPPYMISNETVITRGKDKMKFKGKDISHNFGEWDKFNSLDDFMNWTFKWIDLANNLLKKGGMFCSYFDKDKINLISHYLQIKHKYKSKGYYADIKSNPVPQARKVKWMNGWEIIGLWQKPDGKLTYNYLLGQEKDWGIRAIVGNTTKEDGKRFHPTQKPISIYKKFISYWSNKDDIVLDCFGGSSPLAISCETLKRRWIIIERSEKYCEEARRRIKYEADQIKMF